jgi:hypothetical protein
MFLGSRSRPVRRAAPVQNVYKARHCTGQLRAPIIRIFVTTFGFIHESVYYIKICKPLFCTTFYFLFYYFVAQNREFFVSL